jgi:hypothetical protein
MQANLDREHIQLLITNYQGLVESLKKRDVLVQNQFDRQDVRLANHRRDIDDHEKALHNWVCVPQAFVILAWLKECIYRAIVMRS